jgi:hypothetical protein
MIENLIRTALSTTLAATEVVLSKTLETVRFLNDALEPGEDVRVADTPVKAAPSAPAKQPSWRPPELGDLEATAQALTARSTRPVGTRPPRAAMRRKTTTADPAPAEATPSPPKVKSRQVVPHEGDTQANDRNDDEREEDDPQRVAYAREGRRVTALTPGPGRLLAGRQPLFRPRRRTRSVP